MTERPPNGHAGASTPWPASTVAAAFRSKLDNTKELHHWFLYAMPTAHPNGSTETCFSCTS